VGYEGFLAVEIDFLHPDYNNDEHAAVRQSVAELRRRNVKNSERISSGM